MKGGQGSPYVAKPSEVFNHDRNADTGTTPVPVKRAVALVSKPIPKQPVTPQAQPAPRFLPMGTKRIAISESDRIKFNAKENHATAAQTQAALDAYNTQNLDRQGRDVLSVAVGPHIAGLLTGGHSSSSGLAADAAMLVPGKVLRPLKGLFGAGKVVEKAEKPVLSVGEAAAKQVREALPGAKQVRGRQEALYTPERAQRAGAADQAMKDVGGVEGYKAGLAQLKGELPKVQFGKLTNLDSASVDALFSHVQNHPNLMPFQKIRVQGALLNAIEGKVPTRSEIGLLENVFGKPAARDIVSSVPKLAKVKNAAAEVWNVPRSLMASFDMSAPFRQGLVAGARYPDLFFKNFNQMFRAFGSEKAYSAIMDDIATRPSFGMMQKAKLALTDLEHLTDREEQFVSGLAEKIPVVGRGVRASGRAYTGFLNKTRADVFDRLVEAAQQQGINVQDDKFLQSLGRFVNSATGRGDLGSLQHSAILLNSIFFSPRLLASRVNFLNPVYYATLDPFVRKEALRSMAQLIGALGTVLALAKAGGARVGTDPRNADFAKIKIGDTRIDALGGFQQPVRLAAQLISGKVISSTTGETLTLGPQGPGKLSRRDIAQRFLEGKLAPSPSFVNDWFKGTDFQGKPFSWKRETLQRMIPLLAQDAHDLYNKPPGGLPKWGAALGGYGLGAFGVGLQTYGAKPSKQRRLNASYSGGGTSGAGSPYVSGGGKSSGSPYVP